MEKLLLLRIHFYLYYGFAATDSGTAFNALA